MATINGKNVEFSGGSVVADRGAWAGLIVYYGTADGVPCLIGVERSVGMEPVAILDINDAPASQRGGVHANH